MYFDEVNSARGDLDAGYCLWVRWSDPNNQYKSSLINDRFFFRRKPGERSARSQADATGGLQGTLDSIVLVVFSTMVATPRTNHTSKREEQRHQRACTSLNIQIRHRRATREKRVLCDWGDNLAQLVGWMWGDLHTILLNARATPETHERGTWTFDEDDGNHHIHWLRGTGTMRQFHNNHKTLCGVCLRLILYRTQAEMCKRAFSGVCHFGEIRPDAAGECFVALCGAWYLNRCANLVRKSASKRQTVFV